MVVAWLQGMCGGGLAARYVWWWPSCKVSGLAARYVMVVAWLQGMCGGGLAARYVWWWPGCKVCVVVA